MNKRSTLLLSVLLQMMSLISLINILIMYWFPVIIPFSSFVTVRLVTVAFIEELDWLIAISLLICLLLFLAAISIKKHRLFFPGLSLVYLSYDFWTVFCLLIRGLHNGYWKMYILQTVVSLTEICLLCIYFWHRLQKTPDKI